MTQIIGRETRGNGPTTSLSESDSRRRPCVVTFARWHFAAMMVIALSFLIAAVAGEGIHCVIGAATFAVLGLLGGVVIAIDMLMADRRDFYQRGQLEGWYRGYRMQSPEVDDPLLR